MKNRWYRLDNAALIFPATMRKSWSNAFRMSVTLKDPVDPDILLRAANDIRPRFPTFFSRLKKGFFWCYLEETGREVKVKKEYAYPLTHMSEKELKDCCTRIIYYENRISVEIFHVVTDGTGGLVLLKNLTARYLELKYGILVPHENDIVDITEEPKEEETRDCFPLCSGKYAMTRAEADSYRLHGTPEENRFRTITTGILPTDVLLGKAHEYGVTATAFLSSVMIEAVRDRQAQDVKENRQKAVKITIPVNLRKTFGMNTLRNFALTVNVGINPKDGDYSFEEICSQVSHQLASEAVPQKMAARVAANVIPAESPLLRIAPLPIKTFAMRMVYNRSGESKGSLNISNLGPAKVPAVMTDYIERFEFIVGVQLTYPNNCSVISYGGKTYVNMIRDTKDSELERLFFSKLVEHGVPVEIECNRRNS